MWANSNPPFYPGTNFRAESKKNFGKENARKIREIAATRKRQRREEEQRKDLQMQRKPLKAFRDIEPRVTKFMKGAARPAAAEAKEKKFLQSHAKSGPFLEPGADRNQYSRLSKPSLHNSVPNLNFEDMDDASTNHLLRQDSGNDLDPQLLLLNRGLTSQSSRFHDEFSVHERRVRIQDMVSEICDMPPMIQGIKQMTQSHLNSGRGSSLDRRSQLGREQTQAIQRDGIPAMVRKSPSVSNLTSNGTSSKRISVNDFVPKAPKSTASKPKNSNHNFNSSKPRSNGGSQTLSAPDASKRHRTPTPVMSQSVQTSPPRIVAESSTDDLGSTLTMDGSNHIREALQPSFDQTTREELRLDLENMDLRSTSSSETEVDIEVTDEEDNGEKNKVNGDTLEELLPVVKGQGVDWINANRDGASVIGQHRRKINEEQTGRTSKASIIPKDYKAGSVPKYLRNRKQQWKEEAERREREKPDPDCPPGHVRLSDEDRVKTLKGLNDHYEELLREVNSFPVRSDTLRTRERKKNLEIELNQLDEAIRTYSRPRVFVKCT